MESLIEEIGMGVMGCMVRKIQLKNSYSIYYAIFKQGFNISLLIC